jgi:hypothetical protein
MNENILIDSSWNAMLQSLLLPLKSHPFGLDTITSTQHTALLPEELRMKLLLLASRDQTIRPKDPVLSLLLMERDLMLRSQFLKYNCHGEIISSFLQQQQQQQQQQQDLDSFGQSCTRAFDQDSNSIKYPRSTRDPTLSFPCRLHEILSKPEYNDCITWLPHGRAWKIIRRTKLEKDVIPCYFRHGRYSSFMRQVRMYAGFQ